MYTFQLYNVLDMKKIVEKNDIEIEIKDRRSYLYEVFRVKLSFLLLKSSSSISFYKGDINGVINMLFYFDS